MLNPTDAEMQKMMDIGIQLRGSRTKTPLSELIDRDFIPTEVQPAKVDMAQFTGAVHP